MASSTKVLLNKKNNALVKTLAGIIVLFIFIVVLNLFQTQVKNVFYKISEPVKKVLGTAGDSASIFFASVLGKGLVEENKELKTENQKLLSEISLLQDGERKNLSADNVLDIIQQKDLSLVLAGVIGLDVQQDIISIDKGSSSGIAEGMAVINQQGVLFGKVLKAYKDFSKVMLLSNKSSVIDVRVQQDDLTGPIVNGAIKGKGGLAVYLDLVPVDEEISEGDILITSALEGTFPKDLLVGKVIQRYKDDQKPFQQAQVEPFFNIKNTDNLFVVTGYKKGSPD